MGKWVNAHRFPVTREVMEDKWEGRFLWMVVQVIVVMIKTRTQTQDGSHALLFSQTFHLVT